MFCLAANSDVEEFNVQTLLQALPIHSDLSITLSVMQVRLAALAVAELNRRSVIWDCLTFATIGHAENEPEQYQVLTRALQDGNGGARALELGTEYIVHPPTFVAVLESLDTGSMSAAAENGLEVNALCDVLKSTPPPSTSDTATPSLPGLHVTMQTLPRIFKDFHAHLQNNDHPPFYRLRGLTLFVNRTVPQEVLESSVPHLTHLLSQCPALNEPLSHLKFYGWQTSFLLDTVLPLLSSTGSLHR